MPSDISTAGTASASTVGSNSATRIVKGIPVADPISVLIDLATELPTDEVEDAVNEADRLDLIRTHRLRPRSTPSSAVPGSGD